MRPPRRLRRPAPWRPALIGLLASLLVTVLGVLPASAGTPVPRPTTPPIKPTLVPVPPTGFPVPPTLPPDPTPTPTPPPTTPTTVVGFGDSYTSGEGASSGSTYVPNADGSEDTRHRSGYAPLHVAWVALEANRYPALSYTIQPQQMKSTWGPDRLIFNASSGAETKHLTDPQYEDEKHPNVHEVRNPAQLAGVPTGDVDIAYFGLGGNDAGFGPLLATALKAYAKGVAKGNPVHGWGMQLVAVKAEVERHLQQMGQVSANVEQGLVKAKEAAGDKAELVVALYPLAVKPSGNKDIGGFTGAALDALYPFAAGANQAIRDAVSRYRARFPGVKVHVFDPNSDGPGGTSVVAGHELGQPDSYFNALKFRGAIAAQGKLFLALQESFHPNEPGDFAIGKALAYWMAREFPNLYPKGPDFSVINAAPMAAADDPTAADQYAAWINAHPEQACDGTPDDSICHFISEEGDLLFPTDVMTDPIPLRPIPGATVVSGPGGGTPGSGGTSTWISATYSSAPSGVPSTGVTNTSTGDPCEIKAADPLMKSITVTTSTVSGGGLQQPINVVYVGLTRIVPSDPCAKKEKVDPTELQQMMDDWLAGGDSGDSGD
ncbi:hypothetical protein Sru01_09560 [Sphaerisporangium rufum]|uniref:SGNH hydrolase-type esterase domain-containing protein n=1 Tax=Sphaerisporangium rufum TaxID=1381558 RepID=A0A919UXL6_9ACTN|nr:hypothetical protein [Sphaerisporangium rufum]GII75974.1 hypothetical protein Sru01_09560 [Sphaerisporangium rufum]